MFLRSAVSAIALSLLVAGGTAGAADAKPSHAHHAPSEAATASTRAYEAAMEVMHKQMRVSLAGNTDIDFVRQMIPHHQGALDMAKVELKYGKDEKVRAFARWVIRAQEQEIAAMQNWLERKDNGAKPAHARDYYGDAMMAMHHAMIIDYTGDADVDFVRGMIPHHQGALDMTAVWFAHGSDPDVDTLAHDIYTGQSGEIAMMNCWLAEHSKQ